MGKAILKVHFAGPLVTFQDTGRPGMLRYGVPASGPMDRQSQIAANVALGNMPEQTTIEISMGSLSLECISGDLSVAVTGGEFSVNCGNKDLSSWQIFRLSAGEKLHIRPGKQGSWAYLAFAGNVQTSQWLDHSATHSQSNFGGGRLVSGQQIEVTDTQLREERHGNIDKPEQLCNSSVIRVVPGPQDQYFTEQSIKAFYNEPFTLTGAYDRMGVRLSGPTLDLLDALSIPSEPLVRGSIQVAGDGTATILLADHQTTGGYPKIATLISADMDRLCQLRSHDGVRFKTVTATEAVALARQQAAMDTAYLNTISEAKGTLQQRLMQENLIDGAITGAEI